MRQKGVTPATNQWPVRSKNWILGHWGWYDTETGEIIVTKKAITKPKDDLVKVIHLRKDEKFIPDKENDELTYALGNPEKVGQTRGFGPYVPWKIGFPEDIDTYISRSRKMNRQKAEEASRL